MIEVDGDAVRRAILERFPGLGSGPAGLCQTTRTNGAPRLEYKHDGQG